MSWLVGQVAGGVEQDRVHCYCVWLWTVLDRPYGHAGKSGKWHVTGSEEGPAPGLSDRSAPRPLGQSRLPAANSGADQPPTRDLLRFIAIPQGRPVPSRRPAAAQSGSCTSLSDPARPVSDSHV